MGLNFSVLNKFGLPGLSSATTKQVYERHFANKRTSKFEDFHIAYVEFCKYFNTVMPGQDFDTPPREKIETFYGEWKDMGEKEKMVKFIEFMRENVKEAKVVDDNVLIAAGLAVPAAAVIGKKASRHIPYVKSVRLDLVPNVVFVPLVTLVGIIGATAWQIGSKRAKEDEGAAIADEEEKKTKIASAEEQQQQQQKK